ncbi:MAG: hypothetical protein PF569_08620 [Candidatus Woesearchaeota archaeon]|jgi:hypothetical protein|nr:hypothetical protein [Candidatus Woesearchaeota archaeon]
MDKIKLLNQVLTLLPENIENIESCEIIHDSIILSTESIKYTIKIYSKSLQESSQCKTFLNKNIGTGEVKYKNKKKYSSDKEAIEAAMRINTMDKTIHKRVAYKCKECFQWHIGRNSTVLSKEDKLKIKIKHGL